MHIFKFLFCFPVIQFTSHQPISVTDLRWKVNHVQPWYNHVYIICVFKISLCWGVGLKHVRTPPFLPLWYDNGLVCVCWWGKPVKRYSYVLCDFFCNSLCLTGLHFQRLQSQEVKKLNVRISPRWTVVSDRCARWERKWFIFYSLGQRYRFDFIRIVIIIIIIIIIMYTPVMHMGSGGINPSILNLGTRCKQMVSVLTLGENAH